MDGVAQGAGGSDTRSLKRLNLELNRITLAFHRGQRVAAGRRGWLVICEGSVGKRVIRQGSHRRRRKAPGEYLNISKVCLILWSASAIGRLMLNFKPYSLLNQ